MGKAPKWGVNTYHKETKRKKVQKVKYYKNKNLGGSTKTKDNALDSSIKRLTVMINKDQENDCDSSSQWTRDNMIKLTSACNNYISTLKKLQEGATTKEHQEKRKTA